MPIPFDHKAIDSKWQEYWERTNTFQVTEDEQKKKTYLLVEFPYPSGEGLHVGHPRSYTAMDVLARKRRADGENVLFPMGFDAFGLPAENYAIKTGQHPSVITKKNIENFRRQLKSLGYAFDWSREVITSDPSYYKWTQWIFLQLVKHDLAYKAKATINWCPSCKIGLAHEEVVDGKCERCGTAVEQREKEQWMLKITAYAERLLDDLETVDYAPRIRTQQENWIGKSEGAEFAFKLRGIPGQENDKHEVRVFTTRLDTIYGATFIVVSPETAKFWMDIGWQAGDDVRNYIVDSLRKRELERTETAEKTGVDTGLKAVHPLTDEELPVWVADYVLGSYGTGAIMAVPAHDERDRAFAEKYKLPIIDVVVPSLGQLRGVTDGELQTLELSDHSPAVYAGEGFLINSKDFDSLSTSEARKKIAEAIGAKEKVQYKLRDWVFSRQRYWGEPIPMVHCQKCDWVPVSEEALPVTLPEVERYQPTDTGESPLAAIREWVETTCPSCGGAAERETDTMPNWAGSSWYYLRYADPKNEKELASMKKLRYWLCQAGSPSQRTTCDGGVDWYNGGMEHTTLHLLYSRFWHKFLFDIGVVPTAEPYAKRTSHGMILAEDGQKMSKSRGNVVNPDEVVATYGADTMRTYELFIGPFADTVPWNTQGISGVRRFLDRVWYAFGAYTEEPNRGVASTETNRRLAKLVKKVGEDIELFRFNTAVAAMMEFINYAYEQEATKTPVDLPTLKTFLLLLRPFAPHLTAELWQQLADDKTLIWDMPWPTYNEADLEDASAVVAVQVNGKLRGTVTMATNVSEEAYRIAARENSNVARWLEGKTIRKTIVRKGKLINFVVEE
ncbi:leucine--tRNA ligase [Candidatus Uhrbacteria bacterium CG10_big_fil_rev_8_21_14_0_10_48_11]|uniref:Leucine--tRNA ligase n=1 Tax=Candidatus Uhrbacteria bacterium CG10_big_fil_rev_8_21_14_0_10_48_11 TaxID=1975037 RepID=A0A2M8LFR1_9BACT|nr:MAG: leucine--tRNA ligase [Candidatus Uhrbacteria bacterium CG10_big_fil_rev_8_21_14_0_10_48_11]